jgi:hypothetical protein
MALLYLFSEDFLNNLKPTAVIDPKIFLPYLCQFRLVMAKGLPKSSAKRQDFEIK